MLGCGEVQAGAKREQDQVFQLQARVRLESAGDFRLAELQQYCLKAYDDACCPLCACSQGAAKQAMLGSRDLLALCISWAASRGMPPVLPRTLATGPRTYSAMNMNLLRMFAAVREQDCTPRRAGRSQCSSIW